MHMWAYVTVTGFLEDSAQLAGAYSKVCKAPLAVAVEEIGRQSTRV